MAPINQPGQTVVIKSNRQLLIAMIVLILFLLLALIFTVIKVEKQDELIHQQESVIREKNATIEYHVNENGKIVAKKEAAELRAKDLEKSYPEIYKFIREEMDVNAKNLKAFVRNEFAAHGTGTGSIINNHYYDSSTNTAFDSLKYRASDGFMTFSVNLELKFTDNKITYTQSPYHYEYIDTASTAIHGRKKWFLGNEKLYSTTTFANPQAKIMGTTNILVNNYKDKRWSIGLSAGYGIVKTKEEVNTGWFVGPTVHYSLFKF